MGLMNMLLLSQMGNNSNRRVHCNSDSCNPIITHGSMSICLISTVRALQENLGHTFIFRNYRYFRGWVDGIWVKSRNMAQGVVSRNDNMLCQPERLTVEQEKLGGFHDCTLYFCLFQDVCNYSYYHIKRFSNKITVSVLLQKIPSGPPLSLCQYEYNAVITVLSDKIKTKEIDRKLINQLI